MIKISNSQSLWAKFKNAFAYSENQANDKKSLEKDNQLYAKDSPDKTKDIKSAPLFSPLADPDEPENPDNPDNPDNPNEPETDPKLECLKSFEDYDETVVKRLIFKIDKEKFEYPYPKSTTLLTKGNLPVVKNVQSNQQTQEYTKNVKLENTCDERDVYAYYSVVSTNASVKLLIDFSVALYQLKDTDEEELCPADINNLDIYALENGLFLTEPFEFCYVGECKGLSPYDFNVELEVLQDEVSPQCELDDCYLYAVDVSVTISFLGELNIPTSDAQSLATINELLGKDPTNTEFSRGELASITSIDLSDDPDLDFNIFQYLNNLNELNISNTTSDPEKLRKLEVLTQLKVIYIYGNNITDFSPFENMISLEEIYADNPVIIGASFNSLDVNSTGVDISPLANLVNLRVLSLGNNHILNIPSSFENLTNLVELNLDNNSLENFTNINLLTKLQSLHLDNTNLSQENLNEFWQQSLNKFIDYETLLSLDISNNGVYDLFELSGFNLTINAKNQTINYGSIGPDDDDETMFLLDTSFIRDVDDINEENTFGLEIYDISNNGEACEGFSCDDPFITWKDINALTEVSFKFRNKDESFSGTVTVTLDPAK